MDIFTNQAVNAFGAVVMVIASIGFIVAILRIDADRRIYYAPGLFVVLSLFVSYLLGANDLFVLESSDGGDVLGLPSFINYLLSWTVMMCYITYLAGVREYRYYLAIIAGTSAIVLGTVLAWVLDPPITFVFLLLHLIATIMLTVLAYGPISKVGADQTGELTLLFGKLRNLFIMTLLITSTIGYTGHGALGLLDRFTGSAAGVYIELVSHIGFAAILFRSHDAIDDLIERRESLATSPPEEPPSPEDAIEPEGTPEPAD